jgi:hypothetical protein
MVPKTLNPAEYVEQMASLLNLSLAPEHQLGVVENFTSIMAIADLLMEFPLPETIEAASVFQP